MMDFALLKFASTRCRLSLLLSFSLLLFAAGCDNTQTPASDSQTKTVTSGSAPRTNLPMPPVDAQSRPAKAAPSGWTLLDNRRMQLSDYEGKVLVLDFWATYCPPCLEEAPHLVELQRRYGARGLQVIGLNVGGPDDRPKVPEFVEQFKIQYTLGYPDTATTELYLGGNDSIPQTLVFDRKGKLVKHFIGYDPQVSAELDRTIQAALND